MHTSKNAQKQALSHLLVGELFGNFSVILSPQIRAQYTMFKKEQFVSDILNGVRKHKFLVFISKR